MNDLSLMDLGHDLPDRRSGRNQKRRRQRRGRRTVLLVGIGLAILAAGALLVVTTVRPLIAKLNTPDDYPGPGTGQVSVAVVPGATGTDIATLLQKADVIKSAGVFVKDFTAEPRAASIQPGSYALKKQMSAAGALAALLDPATRQSSGLTLPEGLRVSQMVEQIAAKTSIKAADLKAQLVKPAGFGLPPEAKGKVEGWLFPSTYDVTARTTAHDLLAAMVTRTERELTDAQVPRAKWNSVITEASLIQAEAGTAADMPKIARVLENRLKINMNLRLDTTIHYILNTYKVRTSTAQTRIASPYNTYLHAGLPPGAICNPGRQAIEAALQPAAGPWLYFVATDPVNHVTEFGTTIADFDKMVAKYEAWAKAHPGT
jgi:UPF0755 protein